MLDKFRSLIGGAPLLQASPAAPTPATPRAEPHWPTLEGPARRGINIQPQLLEQLAAMQGAQDSAIDWKAKFQPPRVAPGTMPEGHKPQELAMDSICDNLTGSLGIYNQFNSLQGVDFLGYAALSLLAQHPLIRAMVQTLADEMTRKWIEFVGQGSEESDAERVKALDASTQKYFLKQRFNSAAATTGFMGGCMLFMDFGDNTRSPEGQAELQTPLTLDSAKIRKGSFEGFRLIEPINCYPAPYNADNPLEDGYYKPNAWLIQGRTVHASRLLRFAQNEPPILLKPAYNFFGIPLAQMALDYVDRFDTVRIAVAKLVKRFSTSILKTDMSQMLNGGGYEDAASLKSRAMLWSLMATNDGLLLLDKEMEDFMQQNTPLSGLGEIVSQQLELLAAISRTPAVKLLGISPKGFNSTGEYDEANWYDHVASQQTSMFGDNLDIAIKVIQLSENGSIDEDLTHRFVPLHELSETEKAANRKTNADTNAVYIDRGVVSVEEVRGQLAADPDSGFESLDVDDVPEAPEQPGQDGEDDEDPAPGAADSGFKEDEHPRDTDGKFGSGGGAAEKKSPSESHSAPLRQLSGNELHSDAHPTLTPDNVVDAANAWFKSNLQGKAITREGMGEVRVSGKTWKKLKRGMPTDIDKARLLPAIPDIVANGESTGRFPVDKPRPDNMVAFHHLRGTVELDGKPVEVGVSVGEDEYGHLVYNLNRDPSDLLEKRKAPILPRLEARGSEPSKDSSAALDQSIDQDGEDLNITIYGDA
jgi:phage-related protein (TIGR01555 family)